MSIFTLKEEQTVRLTLPANMQYLNIVSECIQAMLQHTEVSCSEDTVYAIQLAVHELCTNIIEHAYSGQTGEKFEIAFGLTTNPSCFITKFQDSGKKFEQDSVASPQLGELQERGLGVFLIYEIMDDVIYRNANQTNYWTLVKNLENE